MMQIGYQMYRYMYIYYCIIYYDYLNNYIMMFVILVGQKFNKYFYFILFLNVYLCIYVYKYMNFNMIKVVEIKLRLFKQVLFQLWKMLFKGVY